LFVFKKTSLLAWNQFFAQQKRLNQGVKDLATIFGDCRKFSAKISLLE
jgi:hypothetical protein